MCITKKSFLKLNGFDESYFMYLEDVDLCVRAKNLGLKIIYCPHVVATHENGASSKNKDRINHEAWFDSRKKFAKKHFSKIIGILIQQIYSIEELILKKFLINKKQESKQRF